MTAYRFPSPQLPIIGGMSVMLKKQKNPRITKKAAEAYKTKCEGYSLVIRAWMPAILLVIVITAVILLASLGIDPTVMMPVLSILGK